MFDENLLGNLYAAVPRIIPLFAWRSESVGEFIAAEADRRQPGQRIIGGCLGGGGKRVIDMLRTAVPKRLGPAAPVRRSIYHRGHARAARRLHGRPRA